MFVNEVQTGNLIEVEVVEIEEKDFEFLSEKDSQFKVFVWKEYKGKEVYKLRLKDSKAILGLMHIVDHLNPNIDAIEIKLLEVRNDNIGKSKKYDFITGCLIAFACRMSFIREHNGFLFLIPKTSLIKHYSQNYGLEYIPPFGPNKTGIMIVNEKLAYRLIKQFLNE
ncbi:hypothetical protein DVR12_01310 [Chitinophaga silvatica]|uniref:Uncharacterized protein n=1 Tax=Chitinophaga silvatica TaxID=2282649 RepID=A0A3E1YGF7_9BACT|nr:hypothetical protein [Chitinophaga silvatica]RFS26456.1 hypothetical protein DVR12_01310 [Chitinophaga silvatica]